MSNDKPMAVATIRFYPNKHVDVQLSSIRNITPRTLDIASNLLLKEYRGMKGKFIADEHKRVREEKAAAEKKAAEDTAEFHKAEDERLAEAAKADADAGAKKLAEAQEAFKKKLEEDAKNVAGGEPKEGNTDPKVKEAAANDPTISANTKVSA